MNITKINVISSWVNLVSLIGVIIGLAISSMSISILFLLAFCISANVSVVTKMQGQLERLSIIDKLLKDGVFDEVLDIPEDAVERLKL